MVRSGPRSPSRAAFQANYAGWVKFNGVRVLNVKTNSSGYFSGTFTVPSTAPTGSATVLASVGSKQDSATFDVRSSTTTTAPAPTPAPTPTATTTTAATAIALSINSGPRGTVVNVKGTDFAANYYGWIKFNGVRVADVKSDANGSYSSSFTVPSDAPVGAATVLSSVGYKEATATFNVTSSSTTTTAPAPSPTPTPTPSSSTGTTSGQVILAADWRNVPDGTCAASRNNPDRPALPGLKKTDWNIRSGGPSACIRTIDGRKALHFNVPAGYRSDEGSARAEQEPNIPSITPGQRVWIGFDLKTGNYPSRPSWNLAFQFKNNSTGGPPASLTVHSNGTGSHGIEAENHTTPAGRVRGKHIVLGRAGARRAQAAEGSGHGQHGPGLHRRPASGLRRGLAFP